MARRKSREFSKIVVALVLATYFIGFIIGIIICFIDPSQLYALLAFIGAPTATALGFYFWKAKHENIAKHQWDYLKKPDDTYGGGGYAG